MDKAKNALAYLTKNNEVQNEILQEVARIFAMAPDGFNCFIVVAKYGCRFTAEDAQALKMLQQLLGKEACDNMILVLTHGDQAEREAEENEETVEETLKKWLKSLPPWVQQFVAAIKDRVFLFNNCLRPEKDPEGYKKQLSRLIKVRPQLLRNCAFTSCHTVVDLQIVFKVSENHNISSKTLSVEVSRLVLARFTTQW